MNMQQKLCEGMSYQDLHDLDTICVGQSDNLKYETSQTRIWLARTGLYDGEPYAKRVTIEVLKNDKWENLMSFPGTML